MFCGNLFCVSLVARMRCHIRGLVPRNNLQLLIYELMRLVMTAELMPCAFPATLHFALLLSFNATYILFIVENKLSLSLENVLSDPI